MTTKKAAAKKAPAKKTAAKKTAAKKVSTELQQVASEILEGSRKWGSGRERSIYLIDAGFNPLEVQAEVSRQRAENSK